jgi:hypothetical protein
MRSVGQTGVKQTEKWSERMESGYVIMNDAVGGRLMPA